MPKWHSESLESFFKKLFYIDKLSRRDSSDFQAETKHNDSRYGPKKGSQVKKERSKETLAWILLPHICQCVCDLSKLLPLLLSCHHGGPQCHREAGQVWPKPPATSPGHTVEPSPMVNSISAAKTPGTLSKATPIVTKATPPHCTNKVISPPFLPWESRVWSYGREGSGHTRDRNLRESNPTSTSCPCTPSWR